MSIALPDAERRLRAYVAALWGFEPPLRPLDDEGDPGATRPRFDAHLVRLPPVVPSLNHYRAAVAHVAAHRVYSRPWPAKGLKPLLTIVVSLVEDARVEGLAMRRFPGLRRLWAPFHRAEPSASLIAADLLERLARAMFDPDYRDGNVWVAKGRDLFFAGKDRWDDPAFSLSLGGILASELGKTRVQVNARGHRVDPPYRDDNSGLWLSDTPPEPPRDADDPLEAARLESVERDDARRRDGPPKPDAPSAPLAAAETAPSPTLTRYPEWDYRIGQHRPDFAWVLETPAIPAPTSLDIGGQGALARRLRAQAARAAVGRPERLRRQREGDALDLDACIAAAAAFRQGHSPDPRVYRRTRRGARDVSALLLLDVSRSCDDPVGETTILDLERQAAALLAEALDGAGDRFAIDAFRSNGRREVCCLTVKAFPDPLDDMVLRRLAGLDARWSTRLGAALRHAGRRLAAQPSHRRLLLVVTDGEPSDIDCPDPRHLVEDARKAVHEVAARGIDVACIALGGGAERPLDRVFGRRDVYPIDRVERLPDILPALYARLTG